MTVINEQHKAIDRLAPKAEYCDEVLESVSCFTTTQIAPVSHGSSFYHKLTWRMRRI